MASRPLQRMGIDPSVVNAWNQIGISSAGELLQASPLLLMQAADLSLAQVLHILQEVSQRLAPPPSTALQYLIEREKSKRFVGTGFPALDTAMKGGLLLGSITDICGPAGLGKTQFCMSCVVDVLAAPGADSKVIYIDTELKFLADRLAEMLREQHPLRYHASHNLQASHELDDVLKRVQMKRPTSIRELENIIQDLERTIIADNVSLVVIDSIASLARKDNLDEKDREAFLMTQSGILKRIAEKCNCAILATNQVMPFTSNVNEDMFGEIIRDSGMEFIPSLGATWHHCVSTRLFMNRDHHSVQTFGMRVTGTTLSTAYADRRLINIRKSPIAAPVSIPYTITAKGLELREAEEASQRPA